jgi:hypothetical protein
MRLGRLLLVGLGAVALAIPAMSAAARLQSPRREIQRVTTSGAIYVGKAEGFEVFISNPDPHVAILYVYRVGTSEGTSSYASSAYAVRPQSSIGSGVLRARFGSIGSVVLRFHPNGKTKTGRASKHCRGRPPEREEGEYEGSVSLRGEGDYFRLRERRAPGSRSRTFRLSCAQGQAHKAESRPLYEYVVPSTGFTTSSAGGSIALLLAISRSGGRVVYLRAAHMQSSGPGAEMQAATLERRPGMAIGRSADGGGGAGTLLTSLPGEHPATATLAPPSAPFHGIGIYKENSSTSHSWTGTLAVSFPGLDLPLTGPTFATSLCVLSPFKTPIPCDFLRMPRVPE